MDYDLLEARPRPGEGYGYVFVKPYRSHARIIEAWARRSGIKDAYPWHKMHLTMMYDRRNKVRIHRPVKTRHMAKPMSVNLQGPEEAPYLVLRLESESLRDRHGSLLRMGFKHSYPQFEPHLSFKHPATLMDLANARKGFAELADELPRLILARESWRATRD